MSENDGYKITMQEYIYYIAKSFNRILLFFRNNENKIYTGHDVLKEMDNIVGEVFSEGLPWKTR